MAEAEVRVKRSPETGRPQFFDGARLKPKNENEDLREAIGARLRAAREMAGLSQGQIARLMGLHRPSVSEAEAGRRRVSAEELVQFGKSYGVSTEWLTGVDPETVDPNDARIQLAARELSKLKDKDLERMLKLLAALRAPGKTVK